MSLHVYLKKSTGTNAVKYQTMGKGLFRLIVVFWLLASVRLPAADSASADTCAAAQSAVWRFAVIGDTQGSGPDQPVSPVLDLIVARVNQLQPDFAVQLGDKVCGATDPAALRAALPVAPAAGGSRLPRWSAAPEALPRPSRTRSARRSPRPAAARPIRRSIPAGPHGRWSRWCSPAGRC